MRACTYIHNPKPYIYFHIVINIITGDIDFDTSLKRRVALLKGADRGIFEKVKSRIKFTPGAADLCKVIT